MVMAATTNAGASDVSDSDVAKLHALGYAQELRRRMGGFSNFAVSFTIICVLSGCLTLFGYGMNTGGPGSMVWGWLVVGLMTLVVAFGMAEICSSMPTAGGLYYWSAKLAKNQGPAWSWFTGWFNLLGQVAVTAGIDFGMAQFLGAFLSLVTGFTATPGHTVLLYAGILLLHALLNSVGVRLVSFLADVSAWWIVLGGATIVAVLLIVPAHHASASFVFTHLVNNTGFSGIFYVVIIGLLMAQYTFTGFDASAHLSEETHNAAIAGPKGIVKSVFVSIIAGFVLLIGVLFAIHGDYASALASPTGEPPAQIFIDAVGRRGGELLLLIVIIAQAFCGMASVTANSRMIYAFSRDGAVPGHRFWHRINPRTRTPTNSVWFAAVGAFILGAPYLWSATAYGAVTSIATIGLFIAYVIPTFLRRRAGADFVDGPWSLGKWSPIIGWVGVIWVLVISVVLMLPEDGPFNAITWKTFNYAPIAVGVVLLFAGGYWLLSAKNWFTGPRVQGDEAALEAIEAEFGQVEGILEAID
jgi:amino acid permease (GABA permease)